MTLKILILICRLIGCIASKIVNGGCGLGGATSAVKVIYLCAKIFILECNWGEHHIGTCYCAYLCSLRLLTGLLHQIIRGQVGSSHDEIQ